MKKKIKNKKYEILSAELGYSWSVTEARLATKTRLGVDYGGFIIKWRCKDIGFGELTFYRNLKGKLVCETECMSEDFVRQVMDHFVSSAKLLDK